jgi:hypothetical protein
MSSVQGKTTGRRIRTVRSFVSIAPLFAAAAAASAQIQFTDVTDAAGAAFSHQPRPLGVPGLNEWTMGGVCVADFNGDGWPDLYALKGGQGSDRFLINNGNGTFSDRTVQAGLSAQHCGVGATVGDYDRDGDLDIYVTSYGNSNNNQGEIGKNILWRNNGDATFVNVAVAAGVHVTSSTASAGNGGSWGDFDLDGDLDLAVSAWSQAAAGNRLFRNNGNGTFTDITNVKIVMPTLTWGFQTSMIDVDGDRYPELLWAADFQTSRLYRNNRDGSFTEVTAQAGVGIDAFGMGQCAGDFDNDGDIDWYVTSIFSDQPNNPSLHNGNAYYRNNGNGTFVEISEENGTVDGGWGWASVAGDFDNDGDLDIIAMNGRNAAEWADEPEYFFVNNGDGTFTRDLAISNQFFAKDGRTVVTTDYDRDGDLDVVMYYNFGPLKLYRNDSVAPAGTVRNWFAIDIDEGSNPYVAPNGYGVRAVVRAGKRQYVRVLDGGNGYLGSSELFLHFGIADATQVDSVTLEWPRGQTTVHGPFAANQRVVLTAPQLGDIDADGSIGSADLAILLGAWGPVDPFARAIDLDDDGTVGSSDLAILLGAWSK